MQMVAQTGLIAAFFGGWETVLILAVILILLGTKRLADLARGLGEGGRQFRQAAMEVRDELDKGASDAGKSLGGIYGKPACQALTPDNQTAELYDPAVLRDRQNPVGGTQNGWLLGWRRLFQRIRHFVLDLRNRKTTG